MTPRTSPTPDPKASDHGCAAVVGALTADAVRETQALAGERTVCFPAGRIQGQFRADVAGQTWRLDPATVLAGTIHITAPGAWIEGGTVELPVGDPWREGVVVDADNVTIASVRFRGGGVVVSVKGRDGTQILDSTFNGQSGTAIFIWGEGRGADDTLISGNRIDQSETTKSSPISSRAADDPSAGVLNKRITVRGNTIDQGDERTGWFGVELKLSPEAIIVDNDIRGGATLISLPDSDNSIVKWESPGHTGQPVLGSRDRQQQWRHRRGQPVHR